MVLATVAPMLAPVWAAPKAKTASEYIVYFGTGGRASKGIYACRFNPATGKLGEPELAVEARNPSFLAIHQDLKHLYAVGEVGGRGQSGTVSAFTMDRKTGKLTLINTQSTKGPGPCHVNIDRTGKNVLATNYSGGSVVVLPVREDGSLGEATSFVQHEGKGTDPRRQNGPYAHSVNLSPDNRFAIVADLGLDQVKVYKFDAIKGTIEPNDQPFAKVAPGSGPRHFRFHPNGKTAYVINEMGSTVTAFSWDAKRGVLTEIQTISTLPQGWKGDTTCAEVITDAAGRFLYGSNRGHDSIALFDIAKGKGTLKYVENASSGGKVPRNFNLDPTGRWMLVGNQNTNNVVVYSVDPKTGKMKPAGQEISVPSPICIRFAPAE